MMLGVGVRRGLVLWRAACSSSVAREALHTAPACSASGGREGPASAAFDTTVLQVLVCPLSRKALRYDESTNELINDELGIAYPIVDGIPNMIPQDARMIRREQVAKESDNPQH